MCGLLYKDFLSAKGPYYLAGILGGLILYGLIGIFLPVPRDVLDILLALLLFAAAFAMFCASVSVLELSIMRADDGRKQRAYILSLPVTKNQYVLSKYLFLLLSLCIAGGTAFLGQLLFKRICETESVLALSLQLAEFLPLLAASFLFIPAIELPFYFALGAKAGSQVKTAFLVVLFLAILVYLMFGDLSLIDKIGLPKLIAWLEAHKDISKTLKWIVPCISIAIYCLSCLLSCYLFKKDERQ